MANATSGEAPIKSELRILRKTLRRALSCHDIKEIKNNREFLNIAHVANFVLGASKWKQVQELTISVRNRWRNYDAEIQSDIGITKCDSQKLNKLLRNEKCKIETSKREFKSYVIPQ